MNKQEIKDWLGEEVTKDFLDRIRLHIADADRQVHLALSNNEKEEAALHNAGLEQLREVLDIIDVMMEEAEDDTDQV